MHRAPWELACGPSLTSPKFQTAAAQDGFGVCEMMALCPGGVGGGWWPGSLYPTRGPDFRSEPRRLRASQLAGNLTGGRLMQADTLNGRLSAIFFTCLFVLKWERAEPQRREGPAEGGGGGLAGGMKCRGGFMCGAGRGPRGTRSGLHRTNLFCPPSS